MLIAINHIGVCFKDYIFVQQGEKPIQKETRLTVKWPLSLILNLKSFDGKHLPKLNRKVDI